MTPITFILTSQVPGGKNAVKMTRTGHRYPNARFSIWREVVMAELLNQLRDGQCTIDDPVSLLIDYTPGDNRTRDIPGMQDALFHVLERSGLIANDGLIYDCHWRRFPVQKGKPQLIVTISAWKG